MTAPAPTLRPGQRGPEVVALQQALSSVGFLVTPDGSYGPRTAEAVRALQRSQALAQDGIYGPKTADALRRLTSTPPTPQAPPKLAGGLWVDTLPKQLAGAARGILDWDTWARALLATGCTDFALAAFGGPSALYDSAFWDGKSFSLAVQALRHHGGADIKVGALVWLERSTYRQGARIWAREWAEASAQGYPLDYLELDAEGGWSFATRAQAEELAATLEPIPLRVTAIPHNGRSIKPSESHLLRAIIHAQGEVAFAPQIYTAYLADKEWTHAPAFRPGRFQDLCAAHYLPMIRQTHPEARIHYGTALYGQDHPAPWPTGVVALQTALDAAVSDVALWHPYDSPAPLRFWSSKAIGTDTLAWMRRVLGA